MDNHEDIDFTKPILYSTLDAGTNSTKQQIIKTPSELCGNFFDMWMLSNGEKIKESYRNLAQCARKINTIYDNTTLPEEIKQKRIAFLEECIKTYKRQYDILTTFDDDERIYKELTYNIEPYTFLDNRNKAQRIRSLHDSILAKLMIQKKWDDERSVLYEIINLLTETDLPEHIHIEDQAILDAANIDDNTDENNNVVMAMMRERREALEEIEELYAAPQTEEVLENIEKTIALAQIAEFYIRLLTTFSYFTHNYQDYKKGQMEWKPVYYLKTDLDLYEG
jgi:hypothetical protein